MSTEKELVFYINGQWLKRSEAKISVLDVGLQYGDGVFEGIRIYNGRIFKLDEHLDRLVRSMHAARIDPPASKNDVKKLAVEFVRRNNLRDGHFKIVVTRGDGYVSLGKQESKSSLLVFGLPLKTFYQKSAGEGIRLKTSALRKIPPECIDPRIKSLNYFNSILSRIDAFASGADDSLLLDMSGLVTEGPGSNFFVVKDGAIMTAPKHKGLEGITRGTVIELAKNAGYVISEQDLTLYDVYTADEAFMCGTAAEIVPVTEVDQRSMKEGIGPVTRRLQELFREFTHKDGPALTKAL